jgi:hypothetical protein
MQTHRMTTGVRLVPSWNRNPTLVGMLQNNALAKYADYDSIGTTPNRHSSGGFLISENGR